MNSKKVIKPCHFERSEKPYISDNSKIIKTFPIARDEPSRK